MYLMPSCPVWAHQGLHSLPWDHLFRWAHGCLVSQESPGFHSTVRRPGQRKRRVETLQYCSSATGGPEWIHTHKNLLLFLRGTLTLFCLVGTRTLPRYGRFSVADSLIIKVALQVDSDIHDTNHRKSASLKSWHFGGSRLRSHYIYTDILKVI